MTIKIEFKGKEITEKDFPITKVEIDGTTYFVTIGSEGFKEIFTEWFYNYFN